MPGLRSFLRTHRRIAALIVAVALAMKLVVPGGFMPTMQAGTMVVSICTGYGPQTMVIALPGKDDRSGKADHERGEQPCSFAGASPLGLAAADPVQLIAAIAFVLALGLLPAPVPVMRAPRRLRPPSHAPPRTA